MPTTLPKPKPPPTQKTKHNPQHRYWSGLFCSALLAGIPLLAMLHRTRRQAEETRRDVAFAKDAAHAAGISAEEAKRNAAACGAAFDKLSAETENTKARTEMCAAQLVAVTRERDNALRRAGCKNRHAESTLPTLIANLVDAENNRADACRFLAQPPAP